MKFEELVGKTLTAVNMTEDKDQILFETSDGKKYRMCHYQDCCESVTIEDVCGDLKDLIDSPILIAREDTKDGEEGFDRQMWTFYNIATAKGHVTIRWNGEDNGYYSVSVDFEEVEK